MHNVLQELQKTIKELESFTYSVAHDLRAPLRSINNFSQALVADHGDRLDGEARDYLRRIQQASRNMGQLIDDLLKLSRVSRGDLDRQDFDLSALVHEVAAEVRARHPGRAVALAVQEGVYVNGAVRLLAVVIDNLLDNAWKFTRPQPFPVIRFTTTGQGDSRVFAIADNGAGFDMRYHHKLFGVFQRMHRSDEFEGTGIGLVTVSRIVMRHGGNVRIEGACGKGATAYFTLPGHA